MVKHWFWFLYVLYVFNEAGLLVMAALCNSAGH